MSQSPFYPKITPAKSFKTFTPSIGAHKKGRIDPFLSRLFQGLPTLMMPSKKGSSLPETPHEKANPEAQHSDSFFTLKWKGDIDGTLLLLDQTLLPHQNVILDLKSPQQVMDAIVKLAVRGAPAIGVAGAYALCLATRDLTNSSDVRVRLKEVAPSVRNCRPTAVNLATMVDRMMNLLNSEAAASLEGQKLRELLFSEASRIEREDQDYCQRIGLAGASVIPNGSTVITHCNAGALATAGSGTALSVVYQAWEEGRRFQVLADETRPLLQGSRITAWELQRKNIPVEVICDGAAGSYFQRGLIDVVITGSDRIASNGDAANKIGTYSLSTLAKAHGIPFYIAAPSTTFDFNIQNGTQIPIEERPEEEIWSVVGKKRPIGNIKYGNPAFDITPASSITGWITELGIIQPPFEEIR